MALLAVVGTRRAGCEHRGFAGGARLGCGELDGALPASAESAARPAQWASGRRSAHDRRIRAPCTAAQSRRRSGSARRAGGRGAAPAGSSASPDRTHSRIEGASAEGEAAPHRDQEPASTASRLLSAERPARFLPAFPSHFCPQNGPIAVESATGTPGSLPGHGRGVAAATGVHPLAGHDTVVLREGAAEVRGTALDPAPDRERVALELVHVVEGVAE